MLAAGLMVAMTCTAQTNAYFTFGKTANANSGGQGFLVAQNSDLYAPAKPITDGDITLTFTKVSDENNETTTSNSGALRWCCGTQMTITPAEGNAISKVVITSTNASDFQYVVEPLNISNSGAFKIDTTTDSKNPTITWTGNSTKPLVWEPKPFNQDIADAGGKQQNQIRIKNMVVTYQGGVEVKYEVANIAEFLEKADAAHSTTITGEITLVFKSGSFTMWQDESGSMITRRGTFPGGSMNNGTRFKGVAAKYLKVKNLPGGDDAVIPTEFTPGEAVAPKVVTPAEFQTTPYSTYVEIRDVHVNPTMFDASKANVDLYSDAECTEANKVILMDSGGFAVLGGTDFGKNFEVGYKYNVIGFVGANSSGARQFWPIEVKKTGPVDDTTGIDSVETDNATRAEYFNLQGIRVAAPEKGGIYIMRQGKTTAKIIAQ